MTFAGVWHKLQLGKLSRGSAEMELRRLLALVHDSISCFVWRMDRIHLGLYSLFRISLRSVLPSDNDHRKPSCELITTNTYSYLFALYLNGIIRRTAKVLHGG
jgi:hypothetical protein